MTLGTPSTGKDTMTYESPVWAGNTAPRDEFFWISQINKATLISNTQEDLLNQKHAALFARGLNKVIADANTSGAFRPKMYVRYEPLLVKACGIEVTTMHVGRSSQDIHSTFQRAMLREFVLSLAQALNEVRRVLLERSKEHRDTIVPNYTNGVAAQPNSLAHTWLGHLAGLERDFDKLQEYWKRLNLCPMGTTVLNGSSWPLNRQMMASLLGFDAPVDNAYDASQISPTDIALEAASVLSMPLFHITQFIADVMVQYAQPRPWMLVSATYASSAMPQKRNPGSLIDIRRDANAVLAYAQSIFSRAHNLPPGMYDAKDIQQNGEIVAEATTVLSQFANVLQLLVVDKDRAYEELNLDWTASQELADILMRKYQLPFRVGHHIASNMVTVARQRSFTPLTFPYSEVCRLYTEVVSHEALTGVSETFPMTEEEFRLALDPRTIVNHRQTEGGPQPAELDRQLSYATSSLSEDQAWLSQIKAKLAVAEASCNQAFANLIDAQ